MSGLPGLRGAEHVGITVPDVEEATRFFVDIIGCTFAYDIGPFVADDDWMQVHLGVHPRAVIKTLRMLRCKNGPNIELFEYDLDGAATETPPNSDASASHLGFYVEDIGAAVAHLKAHGIEVQGEVTTMEDGPSQGLSWVYFRAPWGLQLELVSAPGGQTVTNERADALWAPAKA